MREWKRTNCSCCNANDLTFHDDDDDDEKGIGFR